MPRSPYRIQKGPVASEKQPTVRAKKISITVDGNVLREVQRVAERSGKTLSAHISEALARDLRHRALVQLIEAYERKHGAITDDEMAKVRQQWQG